MTTLLWQAVQTFLQDKFESSEEATYNDLIEYIKDKCDPTTYSNGSIEIYEFVFNKEMIFVKHEQGDTEIATGYESITQYLLNWDWSEEKYEWFNAFDLRPPADEASEDDQPVNILAEYQYSSGTCATKNHDFVRNVHVSEDAANHADANDIAEFENYAAAQDWIDSKNTGSYYLAHGEQGRPSYTIVKV